MDAGLDPAPRVTADPPFEFSAEPSGDGHFLHVVPSGLLAPGRSYELRIEDGWSAPGRSGAVASTIRFRTDRVRRRGAPLRIGSDAVSAFRLGRLAVALPPILPSLNQIGFDSYDMAVGALEVSGGREGSVLLWAQSTKRGRGGRLVADRKGAFSFPLQGRYRDDSLLLSQRGLSLTFSFGDVPLRRFDLRMQLGADRRARGASLYAEVFCPEVPNYGPALIAIGLCNRDLKLPASGTFITRPYRGPANRRPRRLSLADLQLRRPQAGAPGEVTAVLRGRAPRARAFRRLGAHRRRQRRRGGARLPQGHLARNPRRQHRHRAAQPARGHRAAGAREGPRDRRCLPACRADAVSIATFRGSDCFVY